MNSRYNSVLVSLLLVVCGCQLTLPDWGHDIPPIVINPPATTNSTGCACDLSGALVDPNPAKYTADYMNEALNPGGVRYEECGIEANMKIICRLCCIRGTAGGFWMLSSLGEGRVTRDANNNGVLKCFVLDGYAYHTKGYVADEPQQGAIRTVAVNKNGKYIVVECRKAK